MKVFLQNRIVDAKRAQVSVFDHGFLYGDGIYETVRADEAGVHFWPEHFRRLRASARAIGLRCPWTSRYLLSGISRVLKANRTREASVRITISRGPGPLGLDPSVCAKPTLAMLLHPERSLAGLWKKGASIGIATIRRNPPQCLDPKIKSNNALNTILAKMEGRRLGVFETVLLNLDGDLTEGTTSNLFGVKGGGLWTPALSCGLLEGVTRGEVLRLAKTAGIPVKEGRFRPQDLAASSEVFLTSTTLGLVPVTRLVSGRRVWKKPIGPTARRLRALLLQRQRRVVHRGPRGME